MSVEKSPYLSPEDLNIQKNRFKCFPRADEVAVFRSRVHSRVERVFPEVYDQIIWTNGGEAGVDLVVAPMSFYQGRPKAESENAAFRDSWRIQAGLFGYDVKDYCFLNSSTSSSDVHGSGKIAYTKNEDLKTVDLDFEFEMFVLSLAEAKKLHPELDAKKEPGTTSWRAAFIVKDDPQEGEGKSRSGP